VEFTVDYFLEIVKEAERCDEQEWVLDVLVYLEYVNKAFEYQKNSVLKSLVHKNLDQF